MSITHAQAVDSIRGLQSIDGRSVSSSDALGVLLLGIRLETLDSTWATVLRRTLDKVAKDLPMMSESDAWSAVWRQGEIVQGDALKPDSARFMRDCLQTGDRSPEAGSTVDYTRLPDHVIWAKHCLEPKLKAYIQYLESWTPTDPDDRPMTVARFPAPSPKRGSTLLTRDEAKHYIRYQSLPATLRRA